MKKILILTLCSALMILTSCEKYLDVNENPNNPTSAPYATVFPSATASTVMVYGNFFVTIGSLWSQQFTQNNNSSQYMGLDSYDVTPSTTPFGNIWSESFLNGLKNFNYVATEAAKVEDWTVHLAATCMMAFITQNLVDAYDRIPYTEAILGGANLAPKYDNGADVYADLIVRLNNALDKDFSSSSNTNLRTSDFIFGGNAENWRKFANTLKLRLYLRQTKVNSSVANAGMLECLNSPIGFVTDATMGGFTTANGSMNPFFSTNIASTGLGVANHRASKTMVDYLTNNLDPRLKSFYITGTDPDAAVVGIAQGDFRSTTPQPGTASVGRWAATDRVYLFSAPQVLFMIAEAKERTGSSGKADYDAGVRAAFVLAGFGLTAAGADPLLESGGVYEYPTGTTAQKIEAIIVQKWIAATMRTPFESWLDHNRTGYPTFFVTSVNSVLTPKETALPKRFLFAQNELNTNPNVPALVPITTPVWWAQ
jgi:hypothetical protein